MQTPAAAQYTAIEARVHSRAHLLLVWGSEGRKDWERDKLISSIKQMDFILCVLN